MTTKNDSAVAAEAAKKEDVQDVEATNTNEANVADKPLKKKRRGLGSVLGTTRLKFDDRDIDPATHLFKGHLENVEITWSTQKEDSNLTSFAGLAIPYLVFTFASNAKDINLRKYVTLRISPAESNALTIPGAKEEWKINQPLNWLKHILDVYVLKGKPITEEMDENLSLSYEDFDENMEYVPVEAEEVINSWRVLFENFLAYINNDGKPVYKNVNGLYIPIWMKLLRFTKYKNTWNPVVGGNNAGDFGFPSFVGTGFIELYVQDKAPILSINPINETIIPMKIEKTPNMPNIPAGAPMGGSATYNPNIPAGAPMYNPQGAPQQSANPVDDLPF